MQYVTPFVSTDLRKMRHVFETNRAQLVRELLTLIETEHMDVSIDTQHNALRRSNKKTNDS